MPQQKSRSGSGDEMQVEQLVVDEDAPNAVEPEKEDEDAVSGEEEEYEIEKIVDVHRNMFGTRMGYLVKWKGYEEKDNSWVDDKDADGARDLITEFWAENKAKKGSAKTAAPRKSQTSANGRSSSTTKTKPAKRPQSEDNSDDEPVPAKKKKTEELGPSDSISNDEDVMEAKDAKELAGKKNWEKLVQSIDTIERLPDDALQVFFTLQSGTRCKELSAVCRQRFPQKMIDFYEGALRWREVS